MQKQKQVSLLDVVGWLMLPSMMITEKKAEKFLDIVAQDFHRYKIRCKVNHYIYDVVVGEKALVVKRKGAITGNVNDDIDVGKKRAGTYKPNFRYIKKDIVGFHSIVLPEALTATR